MIAYAALGDAWAQEADTVTRMPAWPADCVQMTSPPYPEAAHLPIASGAPPRDGDPGNTASNTDGGADDAPLRIGRVIDAAQALLRPDRRAATMSEPAPKRRHRTGGRLPWLVMLGVVGYVAFRLMRARRTQRTAVPASLLAAVERADEVRVAETVTGAVTADGTLIVDDLTVAVDDTGAVLATDETISVKTPDGTIVTEEVVAAADGHGNIVPVFEETSISPSDGPTDAG
jgi:hypothetical protein